MARETKRMALYEAIRKGQSKRPGAGKIVGLRSSQPRRSRWAGRKKTSNLPQRVDAPGSGEPQLRRSESFFSRRLDFSMSYLVAGLLFVALLVVIVGAVRLGQIYPDRTLPFLSSEPPEPTREDQKHDIRETLFGGKGDETTENDSGDGSTITDKDTEVVEVPVAPVKLVETKVVPAAPQGNNVIVIQAYFKSRDLVPVQEHFAGHGVETEIIERRSFSFLVTKVRYHSFSLDHDSFDPNRDGDVAKRKIKEIGAKYKAPAGYESFRPNLFQGAYGEKVKQFT